MNHSNATTKTIATTQTLSSPATAVWEVIRTGRDVHRMMPGVIETCRVEGSGPGARRYCTTQQGLLTETLLCVDDDARLFRYRIDEQSMLPLENYEGSIHVTDTGGATCEVLWFATYRLLNEAAEADVRNTLVGLLRTAIGGIGALVTTAGGSERA
jgi:Polyketide cyclase / dehydrase and lipid transport